jgi:glutamine synthetase
MRDEESVLRIFHLAMAAIRSESIKTLLKTSPREIEFPKSNTCPINHKLLSEIFGQNVFSLKELQHYLPKPMFKKFTESLRASKMLPKDVADAVAHAVKVWAMNHGATHYTHWFQPQTNSTAEKHDSFLSLKVSDDGFEVFSFYYRLILSYM